jgi:hypothetical protein
MSGGEAIAGSDELGVGTWWCASSKSGSVKVSFYLFVAIGRTSEFAFTELHAKANAGVAADFLQALPRAYPSNRHRGETATRRGATARLRPVFEMSEQHVCRALGVDCGSARDAENLAILIRTCGSRTPSDPMCVDTLTLCCPDFWRSARAAWMKCSPSSRSIEPIAVAAGV